MIGSDLYLCHKGGQLAAFMRGLDDPSASRIVGKNRLIGQG